MNIRAENGFTLIEIIVVILIIGILAGVAISKYHQMDGAAKVAVCKQNQQSIQSAAVMGYMDAYLQGRKEFPDWDTLTRDFLGMEPTCPEEETTGEPYRTLYDDSNGYVSCTNTSAGRSHQRIGSNM